MVRHYSKQVEIDRDPQIIDPSTLFARRLPGPCPSFEYPYSEKEAIALLVKKNRDVFASIGKIEFTDPSRSRVGKKTTYRRLNTPISLLPIRAGNICPHCGRRVRFVTRRDHPGHALTHDLARDNGCGGGLIIDGIDVCLDDQEFAIYLERQR